MSEPDYVSIFHSVPDLYAILSPELDFIDVSDAYLNATMVKRENILGHPLFKIFPANPNEPNEIGTKKLADALQYVLQKKTPFAMNVLKYDIRAHTVGNFVERYWKTFITPILDKDHEVKYIVIRVEDVTELFNLSQIKLDDSQRLRLLVENIKDYSIIMLDPKGIVVSWNIGAEYMTGYSAKEIIGKSIAIFYDNEGRLPDHYVDKLRVARDAGRHEEEGWRVRKDGSKFWANIVITPIFDSYNDLIGYGKVTRDLTAQKKMEKIKNEFISVVNHELRTPLTSIVGSVRLLQDNFCKNSIERSNLLLSIASSNCDRLMRLVNDILDIEQLENKKIELNSKPEDICLLIKESLFINQLYADNYGIKLVFLPNIESVEVNSDHDRLMQVMTNLISNAVKFSTPKSSVSIRVSIIDEKVRVEVVNVGKGIPDKFKNKIFQRFSQVDSSLNRSKEGTGLGLAISKKIIEQLGGSLQFVSEPNKETIFYFDLPMVSTAGAMN